MLAAVFEGPGHLAICERPIPALAHNDDVLVRVIACGICGTDLHILSVPPSIAVAPGFILGHEYTATVVEVGPAVQHTQPGDRVVIEPWLPCGRCDYCRLGAPNSCTQVTVLGIGRDGGMAEYSVVPA